MNRETYIRAILECNFAGFKSDVIDVAVKRIMEYSEDPVRHGRWIVAKYPLSICSECGAFIQTHGNRYNYCSNCGAKMDKEEVNEIHRC